MLASARRGGLSLSQRRALCEGDKVGVVSFGQHRGNIAVLAVRIILRAPFSMTVGGIVTVEDSQQSGLSGRGFC